MDPKSVKQTNSINNIIIKQRTLTRINSELKIFQGLK